MSNDTPFGAQVLIVAFGWIFFFILYFWLGESEYMYRMIMFLVLATLYVAFVYFYSRMKIK
ncbi:apolipoprotein N-acyltransferase [Labrenzia sp. EL_195]|nr:apolipoprotein N-acyltransferase [Labrenzia sp. EL_195]